MITKHPIAIAALLLAMSASAHNQEKARQSRLAGEARLSGNVAAARSSVPSLPRCRALIKECSAFCSTVGQLEYFGCGGLALATGFALGPPTGAAVACYCGGHAYLATELCRSRCHTPSVACTW